MAIQRAPERRQTSRLVMENLEHDGLLQRLQAIGQVRTDEPLSRHTTFGIGGPADLFITARNADELAASVIECRAMGTAYFVLGAGSNILVGDAGIRGAVIDNG